MKKYIVTLLLAVCAFTAFAQQQKEAKEFLDKTLESVRKAGGIEAAFEAKAFRNGTLEGQAEGTIRLKGEKFALVTSGIMTWYDGKTQWSYLVQSDEVNVSNPTDEEIQGLNPYALLSIYKKGYDYKMGATKNGVTEVILTATEGQEFAVIHLFVNRADHQPVSVKVMLKDGTVNEVKIGSYKPGLDLPDEAFRFDKSKYPTAEVIEL